MKRFAKSFTADESGAISADWVALTAAIMLLAVAIGSTVVGDTEAAGDTLGTRVATFNGW